MYVSMLTDSEVQYWLYVEDQFKPGPRCRAALNEPHGFKTGQTAATLAGLLELYHLTVLKNSF